VRGGKGGGGRGGVERGGWGGIFKLRNRCEFCAVGVCVGVFFLFWFFFFLFCTVSFSFLCFPFFFSHAVIRWGPDCQAIVSRSQGNFLQTNGRSGVKFRINANTTARRQFAIVRRGDTPRRRATLSCVAPAILRGIALPKRRTRSQSLRALREFVRTKVSGWLAAVP